MTDEVSAPPSDGGGQSSVASTPAPAASEAPAKSAREAVQRAFAKVGDGGQSGPTGAPAAPAASPDATKDGRPFYGNQHVGPDGQPKAPTEPPAKRQYPSRFVKDHAPLWDTTPEPIQAEVERALTELTAGYEKHKTAADAYSALKDFDERARRTGTTLADALRNYTGIEDMLRANPVQGFVQIARNIGVHPVQIAQAIMQMAQGQAPQQQQVNPQQILAPVFQRMQALEARLEQERLAPAMNEINAFYSEHPFARHLESSMLELLENGSIPAGPAAQRLSAAYDAALKQPQNAHFKDAIDAMAARKAAAEGQQQRQTPEQIQEKAKLSVTGSPTVGSNPSGRKPAGSTREALQNAFVQVGLR